ncbi:hypothetical protein [Chengkuizengella axinellae]|uniref:Aspartyl-phosphate phosphatase Spo0E family protein n=1 Tax=Chengkuizengella axinellae TaxID=3064388 RepID=A0ABT9J6Y3_9BACL|nr:hypothetical protein [Chengkuizengella sp. 2205SS18-9]MDP5277232.1 hypothetical protein [Chengkuizengella sp. 2205SS18-9]
MSYKQMIEEWESWEHLIKRDLAQLENRIQFIYKQMSAVGIGKELSEDFVIEKLKDLILEVSEKG